MPDTLQWQRGSSRERLELFTACLGWPDLQVHSTRIAKVEFVWYESGHASGGRDHIALQINEHPCGQQLQYAAAVYAIKYRLFSGWHVFDLADVIAEADKFKDWLARSWFETADRRRVYRSLHPGCAGWTWTRIRNSPPLFLATARD